MRNKTHKIYGVGINDADYSVARDGVKCRFYSVWHSMIKRCYDPIEHSNYPTYVGCTVSEDWLKFSNFRSWMFLQDHEGKQLDKDLLVKGNKHYSPETCVFLPSRVNGFLTERSRFNGNLPVGVFEYKPGKYRAYCNNPFTNKRDNIGVFNDPEEAHSAWKVRKHYYAVQLSEDIDHYLAKKALTERYL